MKTLPKTLITVFMLCFAAFADTINVPGDYSTIQAGINAAVNGDTVLVADGTYTGTGNKNIDFEGKEILVTSENGAEYCIIDCENTGRGFYFHSDEALYSVLSGFTITNGYSHDGGGVLCENSSPSILNCTISGNTVISELGIPRGGGINCEGSNPRIINCIISYNSAVDGSGGGISCTINSNPIIYGCTISGNSAGDNDGGGGIDCYQSNPSIKKCAFIGNSAFRGGGIAMYQSTSAITNCTISGNTAEGGGIICWESEPLIINTILEGNYGIGGIHFVDSYSADIRFCDFSDNENGDLSGDLPAGLGEIVGVNANSDSCDAYFNILLDPLFENPQNGNFQITWANFPDPDSTKSPCIDAGDPASPPDPDWTTADIGAFYFDQGTNVPITISLTPSGTPIQIPANGGNFDFNIEVSNTGTTIETVDIWTIATLPNGTEHGPIINTPGFILDPGFSENRDRIQEVPASAPSGNYTYDAYIGLYPGIILSEDHFELEKLETADGGQIINGWTSRGNEFESTDEPDEILNSQLLILNCSPNPFNNQTTISFNLPTAGDVSLKLYDITGREVAILDAGHKTIGMNNVIWNAEGVASGVYFVRLTVDGGQQLVKKVVLMK